MAEKGHKACPPWFFFILLFCERFFLRLFDLSCEQTEWLGLLKYFFDKDFDFFVV
jgi:hypothetical protein